MWSCRARPSTRSGRGTRSCDRAASTCARTSRNRWTAWCSSTRASPAVRPASAPARWSSAAPVDRVVEEPPRASPAGNDWSVVNAPLPPDESAAPPPPAVPRSAPVPPPAQGKRLGAVQLVTRAVPVTPLPPEPDAPELAEEPPSAFEVADPAPPEPETAVPETPAAEEPPAEEPQIELSMEAQQADPP